jgi:hypothetical protein
MCRSGRTYAPGTCCIACFHRYTVQLHGASCFSAPQHEQRNAQVAPALAAEPQSAHLLACFSTPRATMHMCSASTTTSTPRAPASALTAPASSCVKRSCSTANVDAQLQIFSPDIPHVTQQPQAVTHLDLQALAVHGYHGLQLRNRQAARCAPIGRQVRNMRHAVERQQMVLTLHVKWFIWGVLRWVSGGHGIIPAGGRSLT